MDEKFGRERAELSVLEVSKSKSTLFKPTKIGKLPEGWKTKTLAECTSLQGGYAFQSSDFKTCGVQLIRMGNLYMNCLNLERNTVFLPESFIHDFQQYVLSPGDIILSMTGTMGKEDYGYAVLIPEGTPPTLLNQRVARIIPNCNIEKYYLLQVLWSRLFLDQLYRLPGGTKQANLSAKQILSIRLPLPPLPEQKKIAAILSSVDEAIASTQAVIDQTRKVKQGLLQQLLTRGIGHTRFKESAIGKIPEVWEVVHLIEHITLPTGQVDPKQSPYKKLPLIAPNHIESGTGRLLEKVSAEAQRAISGKYLFQEGDVIYSKIRPYLRKATLANEKGLCSADMYPLRVKDSLLPRFLLALVLSEDFSRFAESKSMRTGIPKLNREELGEYICALPPVNEQKKMVSIFESIDQDIETNLQSIVSLEILKRGLMQDLLTGKVRVGCTS